MSKEPQIVRFTPSGQSIPKTQLPKILNEVEMLAERELERCLNKLLDSADDKLFDMADKSNEVVFFNAMRQLRIKRQGLVSTFKQELRHSFKSQLSGDDFDAPANVEPLAQDSFSLVNEDELEEDLAVDAMVNKARADNKKALDFIATRLDTLCTAVTVDETNNPLDPRAICEAFRIASKGLQLDIQTRLIVFKLFDRTVLGELSDVYDEINAEFAERGILPDLHKSIARPSRRDSRRRESESDSERSQKLERDEIREEVFNTLQELLSTKKVAYPNQAPVVETDQLVSALTNLQQDQGFSPADFADPQRLKAAIGGLLPATGGQVNGGTIGNVNDDVIDIITLLFDVMLEDRNLHGELKTIISRLQIPMLKVGLVDRTFFSNRNHPARQLLNELAHISIGWTPNNRSSADPLFDKITEIVDRVINEFKSDIGLFDRLLSDLERFKESDLRRAQLIEKRMREAEEGRARADSAKRMVNSEIVRICHGRFIAEPVKQILKEAWTNVLFLEQLKPDNEESYQKAIKVAEFLVWSVQPKTTQDARNKLTKIMTSLIKNLKLGMDKISFNSYRASQLLEELEDCHRKILALPLKAAKPQNAPSDLSQTSKPQSESQVEPSMVVEQVTQETIEELSLPVEEEVTSSTGAAEIDEEESIIIDENDPVFEQVSQLQAGAWVEMNCGTEQKQRCKLAAFIASADKYIFVNRTGVKIAELNKMQLAAGVKQESIRVLDDAALFDRALESVITNLRVMKEAEA